MSYDSRNLAEIVDVFNYIINLSNINILCQLQTKIWFYITFLWGDLFFYLIKQHIIINYWYVHITIIYIYLIFILYIIIDVELIVRLID